MKNNKKRNLLLSLILAAVCIAFLLYVDKFQHYSMLATVLKKGAIYSLVAVSLNLLNGFTGLFSLGQAGFMMIGAYTYGILTIPVTDRLGVYQYFDGGIVQFCLPMLVSLILAGIVPAIFAWLIGLPVLKLKSDYLAIATLGFAEIMRAIIQWKQLGPLTNASNLLRGFAGFDSILFPFVVSAICIGFIVLLINSTYGRAFKAIRDDEIAAEAMGINLAKHKMQAFLISSFFAGVGGALLAQNVDAELLRNIPFEDVVFAGENALDLRTLVRDQSAEAAVAAHELGAADAPSRMIGFIPEQTGLVKRTIGFLLFDRETFRKKLRKRMKRMSNEQCSSFLQ